MYRRQNKIKQTWLENVFLFVRQVCGSGFALPCSEMNVHFKDGIHVFKLCSLQMCVSLWCLSTLSVTSQPGVTKSTDSTFEDILFFNLIKMGVACDRNGRKRKWILASDRKNRIK